MIALVSASWTIRYAHRSSAGGDRRGSPSTRSSVSSPAARVARDELLDVREPGLRRERSRVLAAVEHAQQPAHLRQRLAAGALDRFAASLGALRLGVHHHPRAPAWITITETLCAITSCSSRAIRARSREGRVADALLALGVEPLGALAPARSRAPRSRKIRPTVHGSRQSMIPVKKNSAKSVREQHVDQQHCHSEAQGRPRPPRGEEGARAVENQYSRRDCSRFRGLGQAAAEYILDRDRGTHAHEDGCERPATAHRHNRPTRATPPRAAGTR